MSGEAPPGLPRSERLRMRMESFLDRRSARLGAWLLSRTKGRAARLWKRRALVLHVVGRRSGKRRVVPIQYFPDGEAMVVVAANSGLPRAPAWYLNLREDPDPWVEVAGRSLAVRAVELTPREAEAFWPRVLQAAPDYERYRRRTARPLPLVRLVPTGPAPAGFARPCG